MNSPTDEKISALMEQLRRALQGSDEQRAPALQEFENELGKLLQELLAAHQTLSQELVRQAIDRRFIREVIAPELERFWSRKGKDIRP